MAVKKSNKIPDKGLYFVPLGGSEEFGVNLNVYICDGRLFVVDCGLGFADERFPGIDLLLPDPALLEEYQDRIEALIITHAHEDHIGAVAHLWPRFECPIYCSEFTGTVLDLKMKELGVKRAPIQIVKDDKPVKLETFSFRLIPVAHSIPETRSVFIETSYGNLLHSGDWNLDPKPVVGPKTEGKHFQALGKEGVLAYIGDSTNAEYKGQGRSESDVAKGLEAVFKDINGKIVITIFSSNIGRVQSIYNAARANDRDVGIIGRSLHRMVGVAKQCGYLKGCQFIEEEELGYLPDNKTVVIMTGSQGEYRAALAKVARGDHRYFSVQRGDTVIFSARAIPGNEREINTVKNNLSAGGVRVVDPDSTNEIIHVSGHPYQDEIAQMYQWLKPKTVIPVHGERMQLEAQAKFAKTCQVPFSLVPSNGAVIRLDGKEPHIVNHLETGLLAVDSKRLISHDHGSIIARRKLQYSGVIHVSLVLNGAGRLVADPQLDTEGLFDLSDEGDKELEDSVYNEILDLLDEMTKDELMDDHFVSEELRIGLRRYVFHLLKIKPKTTIHVMRVN